MKPYYVTKIDEVFSLKEIVTIYSHKRVDCNNRPKREKYDFWQILFVLDGVFVGTNNGEQYCVEAGACMLRAPGEKHLCTNTPEEDCEISIISFVSDSGLLEWFKGKVFKLSYEERVLRDEVLYVGAAAFSEMDEDADYIGLKPNDNVSGTDLHLIKNTVERLLLTLYGRRDVKTEAHARISEKNKALAKEIKLYLSEHLSNSLTLDEVAKHFAVSRSSLKTIFKEVTGMSVMHYHNDLIMDAVKERLRKDDIPLTNIAEEFGFCSLDYFSKTFKRNTGISPGQYRKQKK